MVFQKICFCPALLIALRYCYSPREPRPLHCQRGMVLSLLSMWLVFPYQPFSQSSALEQVSGGLVEVFTKTLPPTCFTGKGDTYSSLLNQAVSLIQGPKMDGAENRCLCLASEATHVDTGEVTLRRL